MMSRNRVSLLMSAGFCDGPLRAVDDGAGDTEFIAATDRDQRDFDGELSSVLVPAEHIAVDADRLLHRSLQVLLKNLVVVPAHMIRQQRLDGRTLQLAGSEPEQLGSPEIRIPDDSSAVAQQQRVRMHRDDLSEGVLISVGA